MESKNIIVILVAIIVILLLMIGLVVLHPFDNKESSVLKITSSDSIYEGDVFSVKLTDSNNTPISKEKICVVVSDNSGKIVLNKSVKTNSKGKAKVNLGLNEGQYFVNATYGGNENYTGNTTSQVLTIKEKAVVAVQSTSSSDSSGSDVYGTYNPHYGTYVREYTDSNGVQHIDGADGRKYSYNPSTGVFSYDEGPDL